MGFWRSLREWWHWDGSPDTDPFRGHDPTADEEISSGDVHAHATPEAGPPEPAEENAG